MQKLYISDEEIKKHKAYFYNTIIPNIEELAKIKKNKNNRRQYKFLRTLLHYKKVICIGKATELRKVQEFLNRHYKNIYNNENFKEEVLNAFAYENFRTESFGETILEEAKRNAQIRAGKNIRMYRDSKVLEEVKTLLHNNYGSIGDTIEKDIAKRERNGDFERMDKPKLVKYLNSLFCIAITNENFNHYTFWKKWNPYVMQFSRQIRTCPYCNRQYITPLYAENGKIRGDLDHFFPKAKYPHFSMSLYNLIPCCKYCNSSLKGEKEFELNNMNPYEISFDEKAYFQYNSLTDKGISLLSYDKQDEELVNRYDNMFLLHAQYSYHTNIAEDIYEKRLKYNEKRIKDILQARKGDTNNVFSTLFRNEIELYRLLLGQVCDREHILDETLSKFKRDIIRQFWGADVLHKVEKTI